MDTEQDQDSDQSFRKKYAEGVKKNMLERLEYHHKHHHDEEALKNWRSWGSWFSWGSPVGFGLFIVSIGIFLVLLHYAGLVGR